MSNGFEIWRCLSVRLWDESEILFSFTRCQCFYVTNGDDLCHRVTYSVSLDRLTAGTRSTRIPIRCSENRVIESLQTGARPMEKTTKNSMPFWTDAFLSSRHVRDATRPVIRLKIDFRLRRPDEPNEKAKAKNGAVTSHVVR